MAFLITATGMITAMVLPGRRTPDVLEAGLGVLSQLTKAAQQRA
ncbi:hypothetical protein [Streptomyces sp. NBC_00989]|nr:hypothetical protein OG714_20290 [Streptomyces sp. NBC_00989]